MAAPDGSQLMLWRSAAEATPGPSPPRIARVESQRPLSTGETRRRPPPPPSPPPEAAPEAVARDWALCLAFRPRFSWTAGEPLRTQQSARRTCAALTSQPIATRFCATAAGDESTDPSPPSPPSLAGAAVGLSWTSEVQKSETTSTGSEAAPSSSPSLPSRSSQKSPSRPRPFLGASRASPTMASSVCRTCEPKRL